MHEKIEEQFKRSGISVVIATFNCASTIGRTLRTLSAQTVVPQVIVVDGGSRDGTQEIISAYRKDIDWFISEPDHGVYDAWNKALAQVRGKWIAFLGGDDWLPEPGALATALAYANAVEECIQVVYGSVSIMDIDGNVVRVDNNTVENIRARMEREMPFTHVGALHRASLFSALGAFDGSLRIAGDYDLMLRISRAGGSMSYCDRYIISMSDGGVSNSAATRIKLLEELQVIRRRHGLRKSIAVDGYIWLKLLCYRLISIIS